MKSSFTMLFVVACSACCMASETNALIHLMESQPQGTNDYRKFHAYSAKTAEPIGLPEYDLTHAIAMWDGEWNRRSSHARTDGTISVYHNPDSVIWDDLIGTNTLVLTSDSIGFTEDSLHFGYAGVVSNSISLLTRTNGIAIGCYDHDISELAGNEIRTYNYILSIEICASFDNRREYYPDGRWGESPIFWYKYTGSAPSTQSIFTLLGRHLDDSADFTEYSPYVITWNQYNSLLSTNNYYIGKTDRFGFDMDSIYFRSQRTLNATYQPTELFSSVQRSVAEGARAFFTITCNYIIPNKNSLVYAFTGEPYISTNMVAKGMWQWTPYFYSSSPNTYDIDSILITSFRETFDSSNTITNRYALNDNTSVFYPMISTYQFKSADRRTKVGGDYSDESGEFNLFYGKIHSIRVYRTNYTDADPPEDDGRTTVNIYPNEYFLLGRHRRNAEVDYNRFFKKLIE